MSVKRIEPNVYVSLSGSLQDAFYFWRLTGDLTLQPEMRLHSTAGLLKYRRFTAGFPAASHTIFRLDELQLIAAR